MTITPNAHRPRAHTPACTGSGGRDLEGTSTISVNVRCSPRRFPRKTRALPNIALRPSDQTSNNRLNGWSSWGQRCLLNLPVQPFGARPGKRARWVFDVVLRLIPSSRYHYDDLWLCPDYSVEPATDCLGIDSNASDGTTKNR